MIWFYIPFQTVLNHSVSLSRVLLTAGARSKFGKRSQILRGVRGTGTASLISTSVTDGKRVYFVLFIAGRCHENMKVVVTT